MDIVERLTHYNDERLKFVPHLGMEIHSMNVGHEREAHLTLKDTQEAATEITRLREQVEVMRVALETVIHWNMPSTGKFHEDGSPMSYGYCFGSNGERDYIRQVATQALAKVKDVGCE